MEHRSQGTATRSSQAPAAKVIKKVVARPPEVAAQETDAVDAAEPGSGVRAARQTKTKAKGASGGSGRVAPGGISVDKLKRRVASARRRPDPEALKLAANLGSRREAACNFRRSFARRSNAAAPTPVLARLVGAEAGRAAEPRVKLVLTLLWLAREKELWTVDNVPAATWALLFGLHDHEKLGAARVTAAIKALDKAGIVDADQRRGREPRILARHESGQDRTWTSPVGERGKKQPEEDLYAQLDSAFWANGWITVLSARAIAALVILLDATWNQKGRDKVEVQVREDLTVEQTKALRWWHLSEEQLTEQYAVSRDLFDRGVNELLEWQLVVARKRGVVERTTWGDRRWYRELRVRLEVLGTPVADVWNGKTVPKVVHSSERPLTGATTLITRRPKTPARKKAAVRGTTKSGTAKKAAARGTTKSGGTAKKVRRSP